LLAKGQCFTESLLGDPKGVVVLKPRVRAGMRRLPLLTVTQSGIKGGVDVADEGN